MVIGSLATPLHYPEKSRLCNGGKFRPFDTLFTSFIPALRKRGFTREDIKTLLVRNPAKAFSIARA
jgi:predicted metal-dependent phosphotriesterase family hydrolase